MEECALSKLREWIDMIILKARKATRRNIKDYYARFWPTPYLPLFPYMHHNFDPILG